MKKVIMLTPALMLENNRKANYDAMQYSKENYGLDEYVVYDQEFEERDYKEGFTYIGHQEKRQGFVKPRNELLKYFYNSDADYAVLIDANEKITQSSLNDFSTVINALKTGELEVNAIHTTMGIQISAERMAAKQSKDYFHNVYLIRSKKGYEWLHGYIIKNFKKYYDKEIYIDERCDPLKGISEDIYLPRIIRRLFPVQLCPTIVASKPSNKASTWMQGNSNYEYPPIDFPYIDQLVKENYEKIGDIVAKPIENVVKLKRVKDDNLQYLQPYKARKKK